MAVTEVTVRRIRPEEYAAVGELTVRVYRDEGYGSPSYEPVLRDVAARDRDALVLVAELADSVVGAVALAVGGGPWAEQSAPGEAEMRMLAVYPQARGSGVGCSLVEACISGAREQGCTILRLSTEPTMHAAHRIYERLGFQRVPERDWEPAPGIPLLAYALALD